MYTSRMERRWKVRISPRRVAYGGILCLILGAITTVAVAWGFAYWFSIDDIDQKNHEEWKVTLNESQWLIQSGRTHGTRVIVGVPDVGSIAPFLLEDVVERDPRFPVWSRIMDNKDARPPVSQRPSFFDVARGWPDLALANGIDAQFAGDYFGNAVYKDCLYLGRPPLSSEVGHRAFPLRPIGPGFVIDTLFYAAIWFGVFFGFTSAKRFSRVKRGRCPRCGYDLRANLASGCSECGWNREENAA